MKKRSVFTLFFFFFIFVFSSFHSFLYNKPENKPGTRKKNVNETRDGEERIKKNHEVKNEYSETGFIPRTIPIELDPAEGGGENGRF